MKIDTRYYRNAGITLQVSSDLPFRADTFDPKFEPFRVVAPGEDLASIHHHFSLLEVDLAALGKPVYHKVPWSIYHHQDGWTYVGIMLEGFNASIWKAATFTHDHSVGHIYHSDAEGFRVGNLHALTGFPSDQIWLARLLADRAGCYLHSAGAILNGRGFLFVGHSDAGKTTITQMLIDAGANARSPRAVEILCDDRNIVRRRPDGWHVYGSWSHGDISHISPASAPLHAVCFLEQANENTLLPLTNRQVIRHRLLPCLIRPLVTADWWDKTLGVVLQLAAEVPCFEMRFSKSGEIISDLLSLR